MSLSVQLKKNAINLPKWIMKQNLSLLFHFFFYKLPLLYDINELWEINQKLIVS